MSERLNLIRAAGRIERALRQERRMQEAHMAEVAETRRTGHVRGPVPDSVQTLHNEFRDELYFLMVAVAQAANSRKLLVERGFTLPPIRREQGLVAWRDISEHWDDAARGKPVRAEKRWEADGGSEVPGSSWTFDAQDGIRQLSGISLVEVRRDLEAVLAAVENYEQQAFDEDWPTPAQAAAFMQMGLADLQRISGATVVWLDWSHRGAGLRCQQSDLDRWKAHLIANGEWPLKM